MFNQALFNNLKKLTVILGGDKGDEGKGKLIDLLVSFLCENSKETVYVCRCAGGSNAGHTIVVDGTTYKFHLLPSCLVNKQSIGVICNGVVVNIQSLFKEIETVKSQGLKGVEPRLKISDRAHITFNFYKEEDCKMEEARAKNAGKQIGTTKQGIGPSYSHKTSREGLRMSDIVGDWDTFQEKYMTLYERVVAQYGGKFETNPEQELAELKTYVPQLKEMVIDTTSLLHKEYKKGTPIFIEGANATMLDLDFGTYPYVTSSNATIGGTLTGTGLNATQIASGENIGIIKAYSTKVGDGPFPTELHDKVCEHLQTKGHEYGTTTGRKRRCGWSDVTVFKYSAEINGFSSLNLTKLDILSGLDEIKIGVSMNLDGKVLDTIPANIEDYKRVTMEYVTLPGWKEDITGIREYEKLPENARKYIEKLEELIGVPIKYIGVGPSRDAIIFKNL